MNERRPGSMRPRTLTHQHPIPTVKPANRKNARAGFDYFGRKRQVSLSKAIQREGVYAIIVRGNHLLLVLADMTDSSWFPGGGLERDESRRVGLQREILEETGLTVGIGRRLASIKYALFHNPTGRSFVCRNHYYWAKLETNSQRIPRLKDGGKDRPHWFPVTALRPEDFHPVVRPIVVKITRQLSDRNHG